MGWLITLGVLVGLWFLPLCVRAIYREENSGVWLLIGPVVVAKYPRKTKKHKKQEKKKSKDPQKVKSKSRIRGRDLDDFLPILRAIVDFLQDLRRKIRIRKLEMKLVLAGDDPCDVAVNYGRAWAVLGNLMPLLERVFVIKKRDLDVACDFNADKTLIYVRADATITLGRLLALLGSKGSKLLKEYLKLKKLQEGGTKL